MMGFREGVREEASQKCRHISLDSHSLIGSLQKLYGVDSEYMFQIISNAKHSRPRDLLDFK